jgi:hypothetical protein
MKMIVQLTCRGLLKPAGYNPYPVPISVPGYRRVNRYTGTGLKRAAQFFLEKIRCTRTRLPAAHVPAPVYPPPVARAPYPRTRRYNGLLKRYKVS